MFSIFANPLLSRENNNVSTRVHLVFFSAVLAGYFAWRTVRSSQESDLSKNSAVLRYLQPFIIFSFVSFILLVTVLIISLFGWKMEKICVFGPCIYFLFFFPCSWLLLAIFRWCKILSGYSLTWRVGGTCRGISKGWRETTPMRKQKDWTWNHHKKHF